MQQDYKIIMKNAHRQRERTIIHLSVVGSVSFFVSKQTGTTKFQTKKDLCNSMCL